MAFCKITLAHQLAASLPCSQLPAQRSLHSSVAIGWLASPALIQPGSAYGSSLVAYEEEIGSRENNASARESKYLKCDILCSVIEAMYLQ